MRVKSCREREEAIDVESKVVKKGIEEECKVSRLDVMRERSSVPKKGRKE